MKKILYILVAGAMLMTACKSKKDYTSWENVYDTPTASTTTTTPVTMTPVTQNQGATLVATNARVQTEDVTITHGTADKYCVIVGSFGDVNNATRLMENLKNDGYTGSCVMKNANNMNRVCCASFATENEARQKLAEVRNQYSDAWLLIRK
ncbi:MAG: SPOR domain-containing protein [Marinifilaceae bacterium]|nr:SPOR domain-containing protein [Marinifilaceae bacterium]